MHVILSRQSDLIRSWISFDDEKLFIDIFFAHTSKNMKSIIIVAIINYWQFFFEYNQKCFFLWFWCVLGSDKNTFPKKKILFRSFLTENDFLLISFLLYCVNVHNIFYGFAKRMKMALEINLNNSITAKYCVYEIHRMIFLINNFQLWTQSTTRENNCTQKFIFYTFFPTICRKGFNALGVYKVI